MSRFKEFSECEECYNVGKLVEDSACAESKYGLHMCCDKYICEDGCSWTCPLCLNLVNDVDKMFFVEIKQKELYNKYPDLSLIKDIQEIIMSYLIINDVRNTNFTIALCNNCKDIEESIKIYPLKKWNGISEEEWIRRYD